MRKGECGGWGQREVAGCGVEILGTGGGEEDVFAWRLPSVIVGRCGPMVGSAARP